MQQYNDLLRDILANGHPCADRTGVGTTSVFGRQMRFDLSKGFPLMTTKKVSFKAILVELLWFLRGDTNTKFLHNYGVTIWDEWRQPWPKDRPLTRVMPRSKAHVPYTGNFSFAGIDASADSVEGRLASTWVKMMRRCYDTQAHNFAHYGGQGVSVCQTWHEPAAFIQDVQKLPHWEYKLSRWNDYELDKDYWAAKQYAPNTCIWLPKTENVPNQPFGIVFPDGTEEWFLSYTDAANRVGLSRSSLHRFLSEGLPTILKGNNKKAAGWEFKTETDDGSLVRRELVPVGNLGPVYGKQWRSWEGADGTAIDQIAWVIAQLKSHPYDRGHIVSAWNVADLGDMALRPCHTMFQFHVSADNKLSCQLYQRSADMFLGVPYNIASYALLTHIIAQLCGYEVGEFIHTFGDAHIYNNHREQVDELLSRVDYPPLPTLYISKGQDSIDDFRIEDFRLKGYNPLPAIKAPVAV